MPWREARAYFYHRLRVRQWTLRLLQRAAYLCDVKESDVEEMDKLYDELIRVLETEWLPAMFIDPTGSKDAEIAAAMNRHHGLLEQKLGDWCRVRVADRIGKLLDVYLNPVEKAALLERLLAEIAPVPSLLIAELTRSVSPNRRVHPFDLP